jgi:hypothetical protein
MDPIKGIHSPLLASLTTTGLAPELDILPVSYLATTNLQRIFSSDNRQHCFVGMEL